jgi:hypothetical protein
VVSEGKVAVSDWQEGMAFALLWGATIAVALEQELY